MAGIEPFAGTISHFAGKVNLEAVQRACPHGFLLLMPCCAARSVGMCGTIHAIMPHKPSKRAAQTFVTCRTICPNVRHDAHDHAARPLLSRGVGCCRSKSIADNDPSQPRTSLQAHSRGCRRRVPWTSQARGVSWEVPCRDTRDTQMWETSLRASRWSRVSRWSRER